MRWFMVFFRWWRCGCPIPVCGLTSIKATILDQGLANVQVRNDVTMHGHILAYHKPAKREALLPTGQISGLVCGLHNGLFYTYGVLAQNNKKIPVFLRQIVSVKRPRYSRCGISWGWTLEADQRPRLHCLINKGVGQCRQNVWKTRKYILFFNLNLNFLFLWLFSRVNV